MHFKKEVGLARFRYYDPKQTTLDPVNSHLFLPGLRCCNSRNVLDAINGLRAGHARLACEVNEAVRLPVAEPAKATPGRMSMIMR